LTRLNRAVGGIQGASKLVVFVPLCKDVDAAKDIFLKVVAHPDLQVADEATRTRAPSTLYLEKFRQKFTFLPVERDVTQILEACKVAEFVVFGFSAEEEVDEYGELCLACIQAQGVPSVASVVVGVDSLPQKKKGEVKKALVSYIADFFPDDQKLFTVDNTLEILNLLRHLSTAHTRPVLWRDRHPYMAVEQLEWEEKDPASETVTLRLTGYAKGKPFSANRLVYLQNFGDFQVEKIESAPDPIYMMKYSHRRERTTSIRSETSDMSVDSTPEVKAETLTKRLVLHLPDPEERDQLIAENDIDPLANDQTILDDSEVAEAQVQYDHIMKGETQKKLVPKGTSSYQAVWITESDDEKGEGSDSEDEDEDAMEGEEGEEEQAEAEPEAEEHEEVDLENRTGAEDDQFNAEEDEEEYHKFIEEKQRAMESRDDLEFPDEVDTPLDMPARQRFVKYRGMKSFRTSPWDPYENLPLDYGRIFDFQNFKRTQKRVLEDEEGAAPFQFITVTVAAVPRALLQPYQGGFSGLLTLFGLLHHEHKTSVLNFSMTRHPTFEGIVKSKDPLIIHTGFRSLVARPIYSQPSPGNKHKFERFFQAGRSIATIYGPIQYPPSPALFFRDNGPGHVPSLVATGTLQSVNPKRVVVKRIILTGSPYKINKRHATIRYMFFNPDDVQWFKPVELRSKYGRVGHIKESLGTHGYMKWY